ncbi:MAG TPA: ATP-dependent protease ATPase subunit HslU [Fimbriimonadaceae bacterium]|nr:ATP-dependent protease ATPase subunit HslU [Fimbriimonadaceae bacterium]
MTLPIEELTPTQIVAELDRYIIGQNSAKRAVAVALRNRFRRQQLPQEERDDILPKNILMIGPTGVGKTEIARRLAQLARAPFVKVEATKFTEVGYVGRDVESMIRDLVGVAIRLVERERIEAVRSQAESAVIEKLADMLDESRPRRKKRVRTVPFDNELVRKAYEMFGQHMNDGYPDQEIEVEEDEGSATRAKRRRKLIRDIASGKLDEKVVEVEIEEASNPFVQVFTPQGMEEMGLDNNALSPFPSRRSTRKVTVLEAKQILFEDEARKMIDQAGIKREAIVRTEQTGIIFLDELDKVASKGSGGSGPDVSREGVQRDLLPIIEGSTVATKYGPVRTDHILFVAAGAFHMAKPSDLIPELQGRLPIRVELENLSEEDFKRILREPKNALTKQYEKLLAVEGVKVSFTDDALDEIARVAAEVNAKTENIGARRLHTVMEKLLETILFEAPDISQKDIGFNREDVRTRLSALASDVDLSRYIL